MEVTEAIVNSRFVGVEIHFCLDRVVVDVCVPRMSMLLPLQALPLTFFPLIQSINCLLLLLLIVIIAIGSGRH